MFPLNISSQTQINPEGIFNQTPSRNWQTFCDKGSYPATYRSGHSRRQTDMKSSLASDVGARHRYPCLPVIIRDFDDAEVLEIAIIENIQRAELNAIEEALGYKQLMDRFGHTQERIRRRFLAAAVTSPTCCACFPCQRMFKRW